MMGRKVVNISMPDDLHRDVVKHLGKLSKSKWFCQLARDAMNKPAEKEFTVKEKVEKVETDAKINKLLDDGLVKALQEKTDKGENPFAEMTGLEIAKLMAQRSPKNKELDEELEADHLSLTNILKRLPDTKDIAKELNAAKGELHKLRNEVGVQAKIIDMQNKRIKKETGSEDIKLLLQEFIAMAKSVKLEYDARGLIYKGLLSGD